VAAHGQLPEEWPELPKPPLCDDEEMPEPMCDEEERFETPGVAPCGAVPRGADPPAPPTGMGIGIGMNPRPPTWERWWPELELPVQPARISDELIRAREIDLVLRVMVNSLDEFD
jgi:hypothetical protein